MGKRLVVASEAEKDSRLRLQLIKRLTGDTMIKGRFMRQDFFSFPRTFKTILVTNNKPKVEEDTEAAWRRIRLVPFNVVIPTAERDKKLIDKLKTEAPSILSWLVKGCLMWQRDGLGESEAVVSATGKYREESDPLKDFLAECYILAPNAWAPSGPLRAEYERFCTERGDRPISGREFSECLRRHNCEPKSRHAGRGWLGIGLLSGGENVSKSVQDLQRSDEVNTL